MFNRGLWFVFLESRCSSCRVFALGLIIACCFSSHGQADKVSCESNFTAMYQHCVRHHPDGVRDLECFKKYKNRVLKCVWTPGYHTTERTYTLSVRQGSKYCHIFNNIANSSQDIRVSDQYDVTVNVFENGESAQCTEADFTGSPKRLVRCGPPHEVSFRRQVGKLLVNVSWPQDELKVISYYSVRYKVLGSLTWSEAPVQSLRGERCTVENLNSSLFYSVQIQCVPNSNCLQCPWSETYTVPSELTARPVIANVEDSDVSGKRGSRLLSLHWKFPATDSHDGYHVTVAKASGEPPRERMTTSRPEIRLILSFSSYHVSISAVNNVSTSPAANHTVQPREDLHGAEEARLNVTVHSSTSFTIYWKDDLIKTYVCFGAEWRTKRQEKYKSFYQKAQNWRELSSLPEPLEPFRRYSLTLHTRPNKDTCNIKYINRSESTYGTTQFYFLEGAPVGAPNISIWNMTVNSVLLQWSSIPEDDIRGFLLGYVIHYAEYHHRGTSAERNITVDPQSDTCELGDLEGGTSYQVQISGFTRAGAGVRSRACIFKTSHKGYFHSYVNGFIIPIAVVAPVLLLGSLIIKRSKVVLWPSIPSPGNSDALQKIGKTCEMSDLESIKHLNVEEPTDVLQIVEREALLPPNTLASVLLHSCEDDSPQMTRSRVQSDAQERPTGDIEPDDTTDARTAVCNPPCAFSSDYTTMEMFQQQVPQGRPPSAAIAQASGTEPQDTTDMRSDHIGRLSSSSTEDEEDFPANFLFSMNVRVE